MRTGIVILQIRLFFFSTLLISSMITGCVGDDVLNSINKLVDVLDRAPEEWQETFTATIEELEEMGTTLSQQVAADLRLVEQEAFQLSTCTIDFIGTYARTNAQRIRHERWPQFHDAPVYNPKICTTTPAYEVTEDTRTLAYTGFFFEEYTGSFVANIEDQSGIIILADIPTAVTSDTRMAVDLRDLDWPNLGLDDYISPRLVLRWVGGESEILISYEGNNWIVTRTHFFLDARGGGGGSPFSFNCPSNSMIVSISGRGGSRIDALQVECRNMLADGTPGSNTNSSGRFGGSGGSFFTARCPQGQMVNRIFGRSGNELDRFGFGCGNIDNIMAGRSVTSFGEWGGGGGSAFNQLCPPGFVASGIQGRGGSRIDQIQFRCSQVRNTVAN